jgi:hypothetical protein
VAEKSSRDEHETHQKNVRESFESLYEREQVRGRIDDSGRDALEKLRTAAAARDGAALRTGLKDLRDQHGWLYRELAAHPRLANLLDDLALLGL